MSQESARAFCVRMMSDDEFRASVAQAASIEDINKLLTEESYDFSKSELNKVVGEFVGRKLDEEELQEMITGFYQDELNADAATCEIVLAWLKAKA